MCPLCGKPAGQNFVHHAQLRDTCYNKWVSAESNARMVVGMDKDLESDERLVTCRAALEAARERIIELERRLYGEQ